MGRVWGLSQFLFGYLFFSSLELYAADRNARPISEHFSITRRAFYGQPFSSGKSPELSVRNFLGNAVDLRAMRARRVSGGQKLALSFDYYLNGFRVEGAFVKALVRNRFPYEVLLLELELPSRIREQAGALMRAPHEKSELIYKLDIRTGEAALVYKILEQDELKMPPVLKAHYYLATNGDLFLTEDLVYSLLGSGSTRGYLTPGLYPPSDLNRGTEVPMPFMELEFLNPAGHPRFHSDEGALFSFDVPMSFALLRARLSNPFIHVVQANTLNQLYVDRNFSLPGTGNMTLPRDGRLPAEVAHGNIFYHATNLHAWIRDRAPDFSEVDIQVLGRANMEGSCNAYYHSNSIKFLNAAAGCSNTAYSTVIAHEYGHFVVERLGLAQWAFGEGYSDLLAMFFFDTPSVGHGFFTSTTDPLRDPAGDVVSYPCRGPVHYCGQTLAGSFWAIRENFEARSGSSGIELVDQLFMDWSQVTGGGIVSDSAHPLTAIEILSNDDDDGDISNGTPNYNEICLGLETRNILCPPLRFFEVSFTKSSEHIPVLTPVELQLELSPVQNYSLPREIRLKFRVDSGSWVSRRMENFGGLIYRTSLPRFSCGQKVEYYFEIEAIPGAVQFYPERPTIFSDYVSNSRHELVRYDFSADHDEGWWVESDSITLGPWERVQADPQLFPGSDFDGSAWMWTTGMSFGGHYYGQTNLFSPRFHLYGDFVTVSYARTLAPSAFTESNRFDSYYRLNSGEWSALESGVMTSSPWLSRIFKIDLEGRSSLDLQFSHFNDLDDVGLMALDDVRLESHSCSRPSRTNATPPPVDLECLADINRDGRVDPEDLAKFLSYYESADPYADLNGDKIISAEDLDLFMTHFLAGC